MRYFVLYFPSHEIVASLEKRDLLPQKPSGLAHDSAIRFHVDRQGRIFPSGILLIKPGGEGQSEELPLPAAVAREFLTRQGASQLRRDARDWYRRLDTSEIKVYDAPGRHDKSPVISGPELYPESS